MERQVGITAKDSTSVELYTDITNTYAREHSRECLSRGILVEIGLVSYIFSNCCKGQKSGMQIFVSPSFQITSLYTACKYSLMYGWSLCDTQMIFIVNEFFLSHFRLQRSSQRDAATSCHYRHTCYSYKPVLTRSSTTNRWLQLDNKHKVMRKMKGRMTTYGTNHRILNKVNTEKKLW